MSISEADQEEPPYLDLGDCLNRVEHGLLKIDASSMPYNREGRSLSPHFLEQREKNLELIREIRADINLYELAHIRESISYYYGKAYYYGILDKKSVERYKVVNEFYLPEYLYATEIQESYHCSIRARKEDLASRNVIKENFIIKNAREGIQLFYEDDSDAFFITIGSVGIDKSGCDITNVSFPSECVLELSYSYQTRWGYFKGTDYVAEVTVKLPEWEIISNTIISEENFSL